MLETITITDVLSNGVTLLSSEALAIAQKLIHEPPPATLQPPFGPPTSDNVYLGEDGSVECRACEVRPAVSEIAIFLQTLLPKGTPHVPGGLRYAIARALLDVEAPPFDSVEAFSQALSRFEQGDRSAVVRGLVQRSRSEAVSLAVVSRRDLEPIHLGPMRDRRHPKSSVADLRRELRAADVRLYEQRRATESLRMQGRRAGWRRAVSVAAGAAAGIALIASGQMVNNQNAATARGPVLPSVTVETSGPARSPASPIMPLDRGAGPIAATATLVPPAATSLPDAQRTSLTTATDPIGPTRRLGQRGSQKRPAAARADQRARRAPPKGVLARLRLQWLRNVFSFRRDL